MEFIPTWTLLSGQTFKIKARIESLSKEVVDVDKYGEIDYDDFSKLTKHKDKSAVVVLNDHRNHKFTGAYLIHQKK